MRLFLILSLCFYSFLLNAQDLKTELKTLSQDADLKHASFGFCAMDVNSGAIIAEYNGDKSLTPASSLKVVTTATALGILGKSYRFKTEIAYSGNIDQDGILHGDIIIKGYGDPTLGSDQFDKALPLDQLGNRFVKAIMDAGIKEIDGHIIGDGSFFDTQVTPSSWQWNDLGNYFAAGAFGLNIHENLYYLTFQQNPNLGATPEITEVKPKIPELEFRNEIRSAPKGSGDNAYIFGAPYTYERYVRGTIPIGSAPFTIKGSIPDPPAFAAYLLKSGLSYAGIEAKGYTCMLNHSTINPTKVIYTHESPSLEEIVERTNLKSVNLYCEVLLKTIAQKETNIGSFENGLKSVHNYWTNKGLDMEGVLLDDGSGLSPRNAISTKALSAIMRSVALDKENDAVLTKSLGIAGKTGSVRNMFKGTKAEGNLRAKSGYMAHVMSYTGYATTKSGKRLSFSVIVNNYHCSNAEMRKKLENLLAKLAELD